MSSFFILDHSVLSCICYGITAGTKNSKSSKEENIKNLQFFVKARNECKVGKKCYRHSMIDFRAGSRKF